MKAYEFTAKVTTEGKIELPDTVLQQLPHNQQVKVIILVNEPSEDDDKAWHRLGTEQLFKGYSEEDAIYDTILQTNQVSLDRVWDNIEDDVYAQLLEK